MTPQHTHSGKTFVITGAARGLGKGIAERAAAAGANLMLVDLDETVRQTAQTLAEQGAHASAVVADITRADEVRGIFETAETEYGTVDVSIHNAGVIAINKVEDITENEWDRVMAVNTKGVFLCCQAAIEVMRRNGTPGRLLNAASGQARQGFAYTPHYAASKFGVVGLTQSLAKELAPEGITVNAYCPGIVATDMWDYNDRAWGQLLGNYQPGELMAEWISGIPAGRAGNSADIADLLLFLASDNADYITGQSINVDGGMFMS